MAPQIVPDFLQMMRLRGVAGTPMDYTPQPFPQFPSSPEQSGIENYGQPGLGYNPTPSPFESIQFEPPRPSSPSIQQEGMRLNPNNNPGIDVMAEMAKWKPQTEASDHYEQEIRRYPNREDYKPGFWRSIGSAIVDYTKGPDRGKAFYEEPFNEAQEDWGKTIPHYQQAANLERYQNTNERTMAYQTVSQKLRDEAQEARMHNDETRANIAQQRAEVYRYKAMNPNWEVISTKGGNVKFYDPATGETHDSGIPSGTLTDMDAASLKAMHSLADIQERGRIQGELQDKRLENTQDVTDKAGWIVLMENGVPFRYNPRTNEREPIPDAKGPLTRPGINREQQGLTPVQKSQETYNKASNLRNLRPDLGEFVQLGIPGQRDTVIIKPEDNRFFGHKSGTPTEEQYAEILGNIYGPEEAQRQLNEYNRSTKIPSNLKSLNPKGDINLKSDLGQSELPINNRPNPKITSDGRVMVQDKNGKKFSVPPEQVQQAISEGYTLVVK